MKQINFSLILTLSILGLYSLTTTSCIQTVRDPTPEPVESQVLSCDYFDNGTKVTLRDNPDLAVDFIIDCQAFVSVELVIQPGVVIEFQNNAGLEIGGFGSLKAVGTADKPIVFTGTDKVAGSWSGVFISTNDVKNELNYVKIEYAGGEAFNSSDSQAALIMWQNARTKIDNCTFSNSANYGLELSYDRIQLSTFTNNTFINNNIPIYAKAAYIGFFDETSTYTGNTNDYILIGCSTIPEGNYTWHNLEVLYRIEATNGGINRVITIGNTVNVDIEAGAIFEFAINTGIEVTRFGRLRATGTAAKSIVFRGIDAIAGSWQGFHFLFAENVGNRLDYVTVQHAGGGNNDAAVYAQNDSYITVTNSIFEDIDGCVFKDKIGTLISFDNPNFSESNNTFINTGDVFCP